MENLQQQLQFVLIQVPFDFIVLVELLHACGRILVQQSPVHSQIEGMPQQLQVVITRGRRETFLADGGVERLNLVACQLIEFLITEGLFQTQPEQLFILVGRSLPGTDIRKILVFHERGIRRHGLFVFLVLARVSSRHNLGLQLQSLMLLHQPE